jgi:hypothetical protein
VKKDIKALWVDALRSGDYTQGQNKLRDDDNQFCCLGVLCELAQKAGVIGEARNDYGMMWVYGEDDDQSWSTLPDAVSEWAGLALGEPTVPDPDVPLRKVSLSYLNDNGKTFEEIAEYIEQGIDGDD